MDSAERCQYNKLKRLEQGLRDEIKRISNLSFMPDFKDEWGEIAVVFNKMLNKIKDNGVKDES